MEFFDGFLSALMSPFRPLLDGTPQDMKKESGYRNERKILISRHDMILIRQGLRLVAEPDRHAVTDSYAEPMSIRLKPNERFSGAARIDAMTAETYHVRSLYFDDPGNNALWDKIDGIREREKFRIRYYYHENDYNYDTGGKNAGPYFLEKKYKRGNAGKKFSQALSAEETGRVLDGDFSWILKKASEAEPGRTPGTLAELGVKMARNALRPKVIVDYAREPYIYEPGNVRVTLDYDIRTSLNWWDFQYPNSLTIPIENPVYLMEVKWDHFLPDVIRDVIWIPERREGAFSKYERSRFYG